MDAINYDAMTLDDYEREINRRLCHRKMRALAEAVGITAVTALGALLAWAWIYTTPDQMSAEYDWAEAQHSAAR